MSNPSEVEKKREGAPPAAVVGATPAPAPPAAAEAPSPSKPADDIDDSASDDDEAPSSNPQKKAAAAAADDLDDSASDDDDLDDSAPDDDDDLDDSAPDDDEEPRKKSSKKRQRSSLIDDAAEEDDDVDDSASDEEEEAENANEYDLTDGFLVDERKKKKRRRRRNDDSDSDSDSEPEMKRLKTARRNITADEDDLALVREARGEAAPAAAEESERKKKKKKKKKLDQEMDGFITDDSDGSSDDSSSDSDDDVGVNDGAIGGKRQEEDVEYLQLFGLDDFLRKALEAGNREKDDEAVALVDDSDDDQEFQKTSKSAWESNLRKLRDQYEPSERIKNYVTKIDGEIRRLDIPERLYVRNMRKSGTNVDKDNLEEVRKERDLESAWIFSKLSASDTTFLPHIKDVVCPKIGIVLRLLNEENHEIPFIWHYRRDELRVYTETEARDTLTEEHLWRIYDLDDEWNRLRARWNKLESLLALLLREVAEDGTEAPKASASAALLDDDDDDDNDNGDAQAAAEKKAQPADARDADGDVQMASSSQPADDDLTSREGTKNYHKKMFREENARVIESYLTQLRAVDAETVSTVTSDYLRDVKNFVQLRFPDYQPDRQKKSAYKKNAFAKALKHGLFPLVRGIGGGISPQEFGENVALNENVPPNEAEPFPDALAHVDPGLWGTGDFAESEDRLWDCATKALGREMASEPTIKGLVRRFVEDRATLTVHPTVKGYKLVDREDEGHECAAVMRIQNRKMSLLCSQQMTDSRVRIEYKHITELTGHEAYLLILRGQEKKLLTSTVDVSEDDKFELFQSFCKNILSEDFRNLPEADRGRLLKNELVGGAERLKDSTGLVDGKRAAACKSAILDTLLPNAIKELRRKAKKDAQKYVADRCASAFFKRVQMKPLDPSMGRAPHPLLQHARQYRRSSVTATYSEYNMDHDHEDGQQEGDRRVIFYIGTAQGKSYSGNHAVVLNQHGDCIDTASLPKMSGQTRAEFRESVMKVLSAHRPRVCLVNSSGGADCDRVYEMVTEAAKELESEMFRASGVEVTDGYFIVMRADDEAANLFAGSDRANDTMPEVKPYVRAAVALGRESIDPLAAYAALWQDPHVVLDGKNGKQRVSSSENPGGEVTGLKLDHFQMDVPKDLLVERYEREFLRATALTGVNINRLMRYPHWGDTLRFVPGLGERKAMALKQSLPTLARISSSDGRDEDDDAGRESAESVNRRDLFKHSNGGPMKDKVFTNAIGFIRLGAPTKDAPTEPSDSDLLIDPIEFTRIHPEDYDEARIFIGRARGIVGDLKFIGREEWVRHTREMLLEPSTRENGEKREELSQYRRALDQIDTWARAKDTGKNNKDALDRIKSELICFSMEQRPFEFIVPSTERVFELATGLTPAAFRPGKVVVATVLSKRRSEMDNSFNYRLRIDGGGVSGSLRLFEHEELRQGEVVEVAVDAVHYDRFSAICQLKDQYRGRLLPIFFDPISMELEDQMDARRPPRCRYVPGQMEKPKVLQDEEAAERKKSKAGARKFVRRAIAHPNFQNINGSRNAEAFLKDMPVGEKVLRPSSKLGYLTLSWKVAPSVFSHIDIKEEDAPGGGKKYSVVGWDEDTYDEIDEFLASYYDPIADFVTDLQTHRKYIEGKQSEVLGVLKARHAQAPRSLHYGLMTVHTGQHAGYFRLFHTKSFSKPLTFRITPNGYRLWGKYFKSVDALCAFFKKAVQKDQLADLQKKYHEKRVKDMRKKKQEEEEKKRVEREKAQRAAYDNRGGVGGGYNQGGGGGHHHQSRSYQPGGWENRGGGGGWNQNQQPQQQGGWNQSQHPQHGGYNHQQGGYNQQHQGGWNQHQQPPPQGGWDQNQQPQQGGWNNQPQQGGWINQPQQGGWNDQAPPPRNYQQQPY
jgi:transcriptional accessory protein Tex/SPT6